MRKIIPLVAVAIAALTGARSNPDVHSGPNIRVLSSLCLDTTRSGGGMLERLKDFATTTDTADVRLRTQLLLSSTSSDSVQVVSDSTSCDRASRTFRHYKFGVDTGPLDAVVLIRYGSQRYVGTNFVRMGEWLGWTVFDTSFAAIHSFGG